MVVGYESLKVEMGFGTAPLVDPGVGWTDVTAYVMSCTINRGRNTQLDTFPAGTCQIVLRNDDYRFDPDNNVYAIAPLTQVRVTVNDSTTTQRFLFFGYVNPRDGWKTDYSDFPLATTTVSCSDFQMILATTILQRTVDPTNFNAWSLLWLTIARLLDHIGFISGAPLLSDNSLHSGELLSAMLAIDVFPQPPIGFDVTQHCQELVQGYLGAGQPALQWIQNLALTEGGAFYVKATGEPTFDSRLRHLTLARQNVSQVTFNDAGINVPFMRDQFQRDYASSYLYNDATVTPDNGVGNPQHVFNAAAITAYTTQSYAQGGIFNSDADARQRAHWIVDHNKDPITNPVQLKLSPRKSNTILDATVKRELRDRVTIKFTPPGAVSQKTYHAFVERIGHTFDGNGVWQCTIGFSSADTYGYDGAVTYAAYGSNNYNDGSVYAF